MPAKPSIAAVTDEDRALDRMLATQAADIPEGVELMDGPKLRTPIDKPELLSSYMDDYKPAHTIAALEEQVTYAKAYGADSIEATDIVFRAIFGRVVAEPYAMYKAIKMYKVGQVEAGQRADRMTVEQRMFEKAAPK